MATSGVGKVLIGEDSESDDEINVDSQIPIQSKWSPTFQQNALNNKMKLPRKLANREAVVVLGEASESSEEEIVTDNSSSRQKVPNPKLGSKDSSPQPSEKRTARNFQHNSLLHRKLRERNIALGRRISLTARQPYVVVIRDINSMSNKLAKSQSEIQEIGPILRQITSDLSCLNEKLDAALDLSKQIPPIKINNALSK